MKSNTIQVLEESNRIGIEFLRTELVAGHTFLDIANATDIDATRERTRENARRAYELVVRMMVRLNLSLADQAELQAKLNDLKRRLDSLPLETPPKKFRTEFWTGSTTG
jgi:hypothetical protein